MKGQDCDTSSGDCERQQNNSLRITFADMLLNTIKKDDKSSSTSTSSSLLQFRRPRGTLIRASPSQRTIATIKTLPTATSTTTTTTEFSEDINISSRHLNCSSRDLKSGPTAVTCSTAPSRVLKGILKKPKQSNTKEYRSSNKSDSKNVRFGSKPKIHISDSLIVQNPSLWWSKEEMKQNQIVQRNLSRHYPEDVIVVARDYLHAYEQGKKQVHEREQANILAAARGEGTTSSKNVMSIEYYRQLTTGRSYGFAGLEQYQPKTLPSSSSLEKLDCSSSTSSSPTNRNYDPYRNQTIVALIVRKYRELKQRQEKQAQEQKQQQQPQQQQPFRLEEILGTYSQTLTSADSSFAFLLGNADKEAALKDVEVTPL